MYSECPWLLRVLLSDLTASLLDQSHFWYFSWDPAGKTKNQRLTGDVFLLLYALYKWFYSGVINSASIYQITPLFPFLHFQFTSLPFWFFLFGVTPDLFQWCFPRDWQNLLGQEGRRGRVGVCCDQPGAEAQSCNPAGHRGRRSQGKKLLCELVESGSSSFSLTQKDGRMRWAGLGALRHFRT